MKRIGFLTLGMRYEPVCVIDEFLDVLFDHCPQTLHTFTFSYPYGLSDTLVKTMIKLKTVSRINFQPSNIIFDSCRIGNCLDHLTKVEVFPSKLNVLRIFMPLESDWHRLLPKVLDKCRHRFLPFLARVIFAWDSTDKFKVVDFDTAHDSVPKLLKIKPINAF